MRFKISESIPVDESRLSYINQFLEYDNIEITNLLFITFRIVIVLTIKVQKIFLYKLIFLIYTRNMSI
jgi:hypothetical protein